MFLLGIKEFQLRPITATAKAKFRVRPRGLGVVVFPKKRMI
jgi:hypothetical protein